MARRIWLLVEWVDERNVFPAYGVVNVDTTTYSETDLNLGKEIFIHAKHENPRRAQILRISDSKRYLQEHKEVLERQDQKVKNVLQLCMRTIKEMKSESMYIDSTASKKQQAISNQNSVPHLIVKGEDSTSDSEPETNSRQDRSRTHHSKSSKKYHHFNKAENMRYTHSTFSPAANQKRRSIISSTPIPGNSVQSNTTLCFDQGTQTDNTLLQPPLEKIEEMELMLKNVYHRFQNLITQVNNNASCIQISDSEYNDVDISYNEPLVNDSWVDQNNRPHIENDRHTEQNVTNGEPERVSEEPTPNSTNGLNVKNDLDKNSVNTLRVRRMSAQTTNNVEQNGSNDSDMVPIGNGNATVPARLLNEIDWNSHTSATRQLLQAIFPRKVLATHSLTGKQSPAFTNKPPKKILDPVLVEDIVKTVSTRCGVPKNLVRNSITIKCTDEAKLYRNRQYRHARQISNQNEENIPPSMPSSDELSVVTN
ncbi:hypothetical protein O3G_MSEX003715 [Manduca sexta]|uniref:BEN domain-containing protein n=1 Tax=Manduca sexta TaxID=7130 RepID=A0A921YTA6_MANSE|nr:hypothetical protein O3G_MSEX003715 [Manduca sexta]